MGEPTGGEAAEKNPILIFITNLLDAIKLPFLPKNNGDDVVVESSSSSSTNQEESVKIISAVAVEDEPKNVVTRVSFPQAVAPVNIKAEMEGPERSTHPVLLWQVYALGGFLVMRWAWMKWNKRKPNQGDDDAPNSPASG